MTFGRYVLAIFTILLGFSLDAHAQGGQCGGTSKDVWISQVGHYRAVRANATTTREIIIFCPNTVQAEVWVDGVGGAATQTGVFSASVWVERTVPSYGTWGATSKHWLFLGGGLPVDLGGGHAQTNFGSETDFGGIEDSQGGQAQDDDGLPCDTDPAWPGCNSPILLDTTGDGLRLTSVADGVLFDLDADGSPEPVAWTHAETNDAWLAWDRNDNGMIDNGGELFGNNTPIAPGSDITAENGFHALRFTQNPAFGASVADTVINPLDAIWSKLLLWRDLNHNGVSEPDELQRVVDSSLLAISHDYVKSPRKDSHGNEFRLKANSFWDGAVMPERPTYDVWLISGQNPATLNP